MCSFLYGKIEDYYLRDGYMIRKSKMDNKTRPIICLSSDDAQSSDTMILEPAHNVEDIVMTDVLTPNSSVFFGGLYHED